MINMIISSYSIVFLLIPAVCGESEDSKRNLAKGVLSKPDAIPNTEIDKTQFVGDPVKFFCHFGNER